MEYKEALEYLQNNQKGYVKDLKEKIGEDNFKKFELMGIIDRGEEVDRKSSYKISQEGHLAYKYVNFAKLYKPSVFTKIANYINRIL